MTIYKPTKVEDKIKLNEKELEEGVDESGIRVAKRDKEEGLFDVEIFNKGLPGFLILGNFTVDRITISDNEKVICAIVKDGQENVLKYKYCCMPIEGDNRTQQIETLLNEINSRTKSYSVWEDFNDDFFKDQVKVKVIFDWANRAYIIPE